MSSGVVRSARRIETIICASFSSTAFESSGVVRSARRIETTSHATPMTQYESSGVVRSARRIETAVLAANVLPYLRSGVVRSARRIETDWFHVRALSRHVVRGLSDPLGGLKQFYTISTW